MNHYPRHVVDYLKKTLALTLAQDGAYCRALDWYYDHESPLPPKPLVYGELRCITRADRAAVDVVLARYFTETPEGYQHGRCDEEIAAYRTRAETARRNGASGGRPRNQSETDPVIAGIPKDNPSETGSKTSQNQNQNQRTTKARSTPTRERAAPSALPDWLPPDAWQRWARHRGSKLTPQAITLQLGKLTALRANGHEPQTLIDLAIESGWSTFYAPRGTVTATSGRHDARAKTAGEIWKGQPDERPNERVIDGEVQRVA